MNSSERHVEINGKALLKGTLSIPEDIKGPVPAILFIAGSGPGDRDGNIRKKKMNLNMYKMLADHLTNIGVITLRYDKRGVGESKGDLDSAGMWDLVDDAKNALIFLKNHPDVDENRVIVLGHSEGCMLATALNELETLSGFILLGGAGDTLEAAMKYQREFLYEELNQSKGFKGWLIKKLKVTIKAEKNAEKVFAKMLASDKDVIRVQLVAKMPAKWFREHFNYDSLKAMKKITSPVLAITGSKDIQTAPEKVYDVPQLVDGKSVAHVINDMNHVLREQQTDVPMSKIKKYYQSLGDDPLHPELINTITTWLKKEYLN